MPLVAGLRADRFHTVTQADTAIEVGSGDVPVLGTPRLIALFEAATTAAIEADLEVGTTTVGTSVHVSHTAPTAVGGEVSVTAELVSVDGRRLDFEVQAHEGDELIGDGTITRVVVDRTRFLDSL